MRISDWSSDVCSSDLLGTVLHKLDGCGAMPAGVFLDRNLSVRCAGQGSMPARARRFDAAMVNDDRGAAKGLRYRVSRPDVGGHILVAGFASVERAVTRGDIDFDRTSTEEGQCGERR